MQHCMWVCAGGACFAAVQGEALREKVFGTAKPPRRTRTSGNCTGRDLYESGTQASSAGAYRSSGGQPTDVVPCTERSALPSPELLLASPRPHTANACSSRSGSTAALVCIANSLARSKNEAILSLQALGAACYAATGEVQLEGCDQALPHVTRNFV